MYVPDLSEEKDTFCSSPWSDELLPATWEAALVGGTG
jgi:hypothetical protein